MSEHEIERQRLLTRIAFERLELARDLAHLRRRARLPPLLHALAGAVIAPRAPSAAGWLGAALGLLRRYPVLTSLLGLVSPLLRRWRGLRRVVALAALIAGAGFAWRGSRVRPPPPSSR